MSPPRRHKLRSDGTRAHRGRRTPRPAPTATELAELERLTDALPAALRAFRDRDLLRPARRFRLEQALARRTRTLTVVLHGVHDPHNQAAVMRTCEALGVQEVHVVETDQPPLRPSPRVSQNAHRWLDLVHHPDLAAACRELGGRGFRLAAAGFGRRAVPLVELPATRPLALVLGNESRGLTAAEQGACDLTFSIPLHGLSQSLNVSVAAGVALGWLIEARRRTWGGPGDLSDEERMALRARFYAVAAGAKLPPDLATEVERLAAPAAGGALRKNATASRPAAGP